MSLRAEMDSVRAQIADLIRRDGWCVIKVGPEAGRPSIAYTIGLTEKLRHPELLMVGLDLNQMNALLNGAVEQIRDNGATYQDGGTSERIVRGFAVHFRELPLQEARKWARAASERYRPKTFRLIQIVVPDSKGRFPWDQDCDAAYARVQGMPLVGRPN